MKAAEETVAKYFVSREYKQLHSDGLAYEEIAHKHAYFASIFSGRRKVSFSPSRQS